GESGAYELTIDLSGGGTGVAAAASGASGSRIENGRLEAGDATLRSGEYKHEENDDYAGDSHRSLVSFVLPQDGNYRIIVTTYKKDETGSYTLRIESGTAGGTTATAAASGPRVERGTLAAGDDTLRSGEFVDAYTFEGIPGQRATIDVSSTDFDTYLIVVPPKGARRENDDVEGKP